MDRGGSDDAAVLEEMQELRTPVDLDEIVATPSRSKHHPVPAAAKSGRSAVSADVLALLRRLEMYDARPAVRPGQSRFSSGRCSASIRVLGARQ